MQVRLKAMVSILCAAALMLAPVPVRPIPGAAASGADGGLPPLIGPGDPNAGAMLDRQLAYSTLLGGGGRDAAFAIAVGPDGALYLAGSTRSADFPTTPPGLGSRFGGGEVDAFLAKLRPDGSGPERAIFLGGSGRDEALAIAIGEDGAVYVAGSTQSADFPTTSGAIKTASNAARGARDGFVVKLDPSGRELLYATLLGGAGDEAAQAIAVDRAGAVYVAGFTQSVDFPTTPGAIDATFNGPSGSAFGDAFVAKLNVAGGELEYATYLGSSGDDAAFALEVDEAGFAYVAGVTGRGDFPTTPAAFDTSFNGVRDAFVAKLDPAGTELAYSGFLGGSGDDAALAIATGADGALYVAGRTGSHDFPTTPDATGSTFNGGGFDAFAAKLDPDGGRLAASTLLGGSGEDMAYALAVDGAGAPYVVGSTRSSDLPITADAIDGSFGRADLPFGSAYFGDAFVAGLDPTGLALAYASFLGGSGDDHAFAVAVDGRGGVHVAGLTTSGDFPMTPDALGGSFSGLQDAFVVGLTIAGAPDARAAAPVVEAGGAAGAATVLGNSPSWGH